MRRWVPSPVDVAAAAALVTVVLLEAWLLAPDDLPVVPVATSYAVGAAAIAWHRIVPMAALVVGMTALAVIPGSLGVDPAWSIGWVVAVLFLMASAGYHARRPVVALAVAFLLLAASIVLQKGFVPEDVVFAWLLTGGAWLGGRAVAGRTARAELSEQRAAASEREAHWRAAAAVAEERLRIARELHDVVSHSLSVMTLHAGGVRRLLHPDQVDERAALEIIERTGRESLTEMHRVLGVLRAPEEPAPAPGLARLPELVDDIRAAGLAAELTVTGEEHELPPGVDLAAYRILQEALTNVLRHADARRVDCAVSYGPSVVELAVTDDGKGSGRGEAASGGHGLVGMRERAHMYGGSVTAGPAPGGGWVVRAVLPILRQGTSSGAPAAAGEARP